MYKNYHYENDFTSAAIETKRINKLKIKKWCKLYIYLIILGPT